MVKRDRIADRRDLSLRVSQEELPTPSPPAPTQKALGLLN
jgi:hypothetical protein